MDKTSHQTKNEGSRRRDLFEATTESLSGVVLGREEGCGSAADAKALGVESLERSGRQLR